MNTIRPITKTEYRALIVICNYYRDICTIWYHMLLLMIEEATEPKEKSNWNKNIEQEFKYLNNMISYVTLMYCHDWKITLTVHTDAYDKWLGYVIIQNNKPTALLLRILSNVKYNHAMKEEELLLILEFLK